MKDLGGPSELVKSLVDLEKKRIGNSVVSPTFFWRAFTAVQKEFEEKTQYDAGEFLNGLVTTLEDKTLMNALMGEVVFRVSCKIGTCKSV